MKHITIFLSLLLLSLNTFADLLFIQNNLSEDVTLIATFNNRDKAKSPQTTTLFLINPSNKLLPHSLNDRQKELGFIDYQKIAIHNSDEKEICAKDFSQVSPNVELKINIVISEKGCAFDVKECKDCFQKIE
ncbi:MAG TPA: hypothetical protein VHM20_04085 [Gammaproteobacteria bacterium]|nr:hypothetical protein [Gammaproteobacteria bacterium]